MSANNVVVLLTLPTLKPIKYVKSYPTKENVRAWCVRNVMCVVKRSEYDVKVRRRLGMSFCAARVVLV